MQENEPLKTRAYDIAEQVNSGKWTTLQVADVFVKKTENLHRLLNTHIYWDMDLALRQAEIQHDYNLAAIKSGKRLPLAGVPFVIKDNILTKNSVTTCGSKYLESFRSPYSASVVDRLTAAGALVLGKSNLDEFGMGSTNEFSHFGPVFNPWNTAHVPGGSSGGSAAAVSASMASCSLGSDTGGSVRQPASFCGIVGLKPSYGRVSRYGLVAYASSLDQIGPMAKSCLDAALVYDVISGFDPLDATSVKMEVSSAVAAIKKIRGKSLKGWRIGVIEELLDADLQPEVAHAISESIDVLRDLGAEIKKISIPSIKFAVSSYYLIATAEASSNLSRFDGVRYGHSSSRSDGSLRDLYTSSRSEGFGREVKKRIMLGTFALSSGYYDAYYDKALQVRSLITEEIDKCFNEVDVMLMPSSSTTAFPLGSKSSDTLAMYMSDLFTILANLGGFPAISVPCGYDNKRLPIGLQFMAPRFAESSLFQCAYQYEQVTQWVEKHEPKC